MDEHFLQNTYDLQLPASTLQGNFNYVPHLAENTFYHEHMVKPEDYGGYFVPQSIGYQQMAPNYVEYLLGNGICNMQEVITYKSTGVGCSFTPQESFINMEGHQADPRDVNPYVRLLRQQHEQVAVNNYPNTQHKICYQKQMSNESVDKGVQYQSNMSASTSGIPTKSCKKYLRRKTSDADRRRRTRIAAALDALGDLLPHPKEGNKTNLVDDCIDYIKYLQLHMRELSKNRLSGEPTSNHLMYLEGCGHYLVHENTGSGPLQDILGEILESNPSEATKLLQSRGLFMMPFAPN